MRQHALEYAFDPLLRLVDRVLAQAVHANQASCLARSRTAPLPRVVSTLHPVKEGVYPWKVSTYDLGDGIRQVWKPLQKAGRSEMSTTRVDIDDDVTALLHELNQPVQEVVREFLVLELYRRGTISSGKAAQLLGMSRWEFIRHASRLGIALFDMTEEEWQAERSRAEAI